MTETVLNIIFGVIFGVPLAFVAISVAGERRAEARVRRRVAATERKEIVDGKEYSAVTQTLSIVREKRTGRMGILLEGGAERDPTTIAGETTLVPRWIRIQFVRKSDGKVGRIEWRRFAKVDVLGTADVDFLSRRTGFLRSESAIRYPRTIGQTKHRTR